MKTFKSPTCSRAADAYCLMDACQVLEQCLYRPTAILMGCCRRNSLGEERQKALTDNGITGPSQSENHLIQLLSLYFRFKVRNIENCKIYFLKFPVPTAG